MAQVAIWVGLGVLLVALVALQVAGDRALRGWGVEPSRAVRVIRTVNTVAVVGLTLFVFWEWVIA